MRDKAYCRMEDGAERGGGVSIESIGCNERENADAVPEAAKVTVSQLKSCDTWLGHLSFRLLPLMSGVRRAESAETPVRGRPWFVSQFCCILVYKETNNMVYIATIL